MAAIDIHIIGLATKHDAEQRLLKAEKLGVLGLLIKI